MPPRKRPTRNITLPYRFSSPLGSPSLLSRRPTITTRAKSRSSSRRTKRNAAELDRAIRRQADEVGN